MENNKKSNNLIKEMLEDSLVQQVVKDFSHESIITKNSDFLKEMEELSNKINKKITYSKLEEIKSPYKSHKIYPEISKEIDKVNEEVLNKVNQYPDFNEKENKIYGNLKTDSLEIILNSISSLKSSQNTSELYSSLSKIKSNSLNDMNFLKVFESLNESVEKHYPNYSKDKAYDFDFELDTDMMLSISKGRRDKVINYVKEKYSIKGSFEKLKNELEVNKVENTHPSQKNKPKI